VEALRTRLDDVAGHSELFATSLAAMEMEVEAQLVMFNRLHERSIELDGEILDLRAKKRDLNHELEKLKKRLEQLHSARPRQRYTAFIELEVEKTGELTINFSYVVTGAAWKPLYDLRYSEEGEEATLEVGYLAQVTQQTGEAWEDLSVSLSTARPALAATLPELKPWYIEPIRPVPLRSTSLEAKHVRALASAAPEEYSVEKLDSAELFNAQVATAEVDVSGATVTYRIPGTVSVPPDGAPHKLHIVNFSLPTTLDYVASPRLVESVYRRAKVLNDSPHTLLAGAANLFARGEFIGTTSLDLTATGGEILLYLGVDDRIVIEREMVRREVDKRLIGGKRRIRYGYEITLQNLLSHDINLETHDQIPVPRHEEIKVRLEGANPELAEHEELNLLMWNLKIAAGEKATIRYDFSIEYPRDMTINGLP